jgi:hypothetical protein
VLALTSNRETKWGQCVLKQTAFAAAVLAAAWIAYCLSTSS